MDDVNRVETEEDGIRAGALRLLKVRRQYEALTGRTYGSPAATPLPPGLERDPIALQLQKMGRPVTRAAWLMLDRGSDDLTDLDPETAAMLDRVFPEET